MDHVYIIENEPSENVVSAWSTPEKAVRATYDVDDNDMVEVLDLDLEDMGRGGWIKVTIEEAIKRMTAHRNFHDASYPIITKVTIDSES